MSFYRNRPYRGFGNSMLVGGEQSARAVIEGAVPPAPGPLPTGLIAPSPPQTWPAYEIRPEFFQALPQKNIVPPLADEKTVQSLMRNGWAQPADTQPAVPRGPEDVGPPAPVVPFFRTSAAEAIDRANAADERAVRSTRVLNERGLTAAAAQHEAEKAEKAARLDPSPTRQEEARAAKERAYTAEDLAAQAERAAERDRARAAKEAARATEAALAETAAQQALIDQGQGNGWSAPLPPDVPLKVLPDGTVVPSSGPGYLLPVGGGAAAGFMLAGPIGALVGAVLGGGYVYARRQAGPVTTTVGPAGALPVTPQEHMGRWKW